MLSSNANAMSTREGSEVHGSMFSLPFELTAVTALCNKRSVFNSTFSHNHLTVRTTYLSYNEVARRCS